MTTTEQTYDVTDKEFVSESVIIEMTAREILRLASKMPYAMDDDARLSYDYLLDQFGLVRLLKVTGIAGPRRLIERAVIVRADAEAAVTSQEVAA